jgi:glycosyltransferase involved in cell wall biosynthesis
MSKKTNPNKKAKICLNAMVANEAPTITRMLDSCVEYISYWVIQDNGSTDGTQDIIRDYFTQRNIPGFLYETPWEYPGFNRDHALQTCLKADHKCDWILRMDADEQLNIDKDFDWSLLNNTSVQSWNITADCGSSLYFRTWMWNAKLPWFFQHDKRHETIHLPEIGENFQRISLPKSFRHIITNDGQTWFSPMKFITDGLTLELDKVPTNKVLNDSYHLWYIAKSYNDGYRDIQNLPFGKLHSDEYARRCIFYFNMYLNQNHNFLHTHHPTQIDDMGYYACLLIGKAYDWLGDYQNMLFYYKIASKFNPKRNENLIELALYYQKINQWVNMIEVTSILISPERVNPFPEFSFLIENSAYQDTGTLCNELHKIATQHVWGI